MSVVHVTSFYFKPAKTSPSAASTLAIKLKHSAIEFAGNELEFAGLGPQFTRFLFCPAIIIAVPQQECIRKAIC